MAENNQTPSCPLDGCGCVGYAYVPIQYLDTVYSACESLENGTVFPELKLTIDEYGKVCKKTGGIM
jgi:hypothetical protein